MNSPYFLAAFLLFFGVFTIFIGSSVLFDWMGMRAKEGNYVPFVVQANVICGFIYLLAALAIFRRNPRATRFLFFACLLLLFTFVAFYIHITNGGAYEKKTIAAMSFRTGLTMLLTFISYRLMSRNR